MAEQPATDLESYLMTHAPVDRRKPEPKKQALDAYVDLLNLLAESKRMIAFWEEEKEKFQKRIADVMGDAEIGTINGEQVLTYAFEERFRGEDFKKAYPDMHKLYTREVTKETFDLAAFKLTRPKEYEEFRVRSMKSTWKEGR